MDNVIQNYVFDFYGTLVDVRTDEHCAKTWKKWLRVLDKRKIKHPEYFVFRREFFELDKKYREKLKEELKCEFPEIDIIDVYRELFDRYGNGILDDELLKELSYAFRVASREYIRLFPGVREYIELLNKNGKHTYILSNAQRSYTWPEIEMFELEKLTEDQIISSDHLYMKPEKAFFDVLINKHKLDRNATLMHGDSRFSDINGAINSNIHYVHLVNENHPQKYWADKVKELN
ncbi:MAG: HAD family hydrolase [Lachnospiraceae bacterium]|nr:HAD family hydrolase [Lachnospiraceae bacterium]